MSDRLTDHQVGEDGRTWSVLECPMPERHVAYWAARRLTDESAAGVEAAVVLATEVQASRKLIADLRALHDRGGEMPYYCAECALIYPCLTIRLIDEAGI